MKFFIDTANLKEIREANEMGILDGVTTNPSLIAKEGKPFKETILEICKVVDGLDPWAGIQVETRINREVRQHGTTADFIFPLDVIIRHITAAMTLVPGDVIATGTPEGVGPLHAGDVVEISVEGVGTLRNPVVNEQ